MCILDDMFKDRNVLFLFHYSFLFCFISTGSVYCNHTVAIQIHSFFDWIQSIHRILYFFYRIKRKKNCKTNSFLCFMHSFFFFFHLAIFQEWQTNETRRYGVFRVYNEHCVDLYIEIASSHNFPANQYQLNYSKRTTPNRSSSKQPLNRNSHRLYKQL